MKKAAVLNDISGFGKCSLTVALPVLSAMGIQCCPIPTAVLTSQSEYTYYKSCDLTDMIPNFTEAWQHNGESFDAIYSGYMTGPKQISHFMDFVDCFYKENTLLLVDPVMGDNGMTYDVFDQQLLDSMKCLISRADIITPNITEACLLADIDVSTIEKFSSKEDSTKFASELGFIIKDSCKNNPDIVITGIKYIEDQKPFISNCAITQTGVNCFSSSFLDKSYSGTGDLFASILCGARLNNLSTDEGMEIASDFIELCIKDTMRDNTPSVAGVNFEKYLSRLVRHVK